MELVLYGSAYLTDFMFLYFSYTPDVTNLSALQVSVSGYTK
jgi:hypothetical protein